MEAFRSESGSDSGRRRTRKNRKAKIEKKMNERKSVSIELRSVDTSLAIFDYVLY